MWAWIERTGRKGPVSLLVVAALLAGSASAVSAQDAGSEVRLRKIESEIRALQRKVFPGGDERFFKPEVSTGTSGQAGTAAPSTSAVTDILTRMDAIEAQLARLTGQVEENANRIGVLEERAGIIRTTPATGATPAPTATAAASDTTPAPAPAPALPLTPRRKVGPQTLRAKV